VKSNAQWRICFRFVEGDAFDVEITDYHCAMAIPNKRRRNIPPTHPGVVAVRLGGAQII
jgi:hypothetical protein